MLKKTLLLVILVPVFTFLMITGVNFMKASDNGTALDSPTALVIEFYPKEGREQELREYFQKYSNIARYVDVAPGSVSHMILEPNNKNAPFVHLTVWKTSEAYEKAISRFTRDETVSKDHLKGFPQDALAKPFVYRSYNLMGEPQL